MPKNHLAGQNGQYRKDIYPGLIVDIVLKQDQKSEKLTRGVVQDVLSHGEYYRHGVKVRLAMPDTEDIYRVGRVQYIIGDCPFYGAKRIEIGQINGRLLGYAATMEQIQQLIRYQLNLETKEGAVLSWPHLYDPKRASSPLRTILKDRKLRVDEEKPMSGQPRYAVFTVKNDTIIRFEYFQGKDTLKCVYDIRRKDLYQEKFDQYLSIFQ